MDKPDAYPWKEGMAVFSDRWSDQQVVMFLTPTKLILGNGLQFYRHNARQVGDWIPWDRATIRPDTPQAEQERADVAERRRLSIILHNATFRSEVTLDQLREALAVLRKGLED